MSACAETVVLADCLDMTAASDLAGRLNAARGRPIVLDASKVRRLGGQCLQLLLAARMAWDMDEISFEIVGATPEFTEALTLMGGADLFTVTQREPQ